MIPEDRSVDWFEKRVNEHGLDAALSTNPEKIFRISAVILPIDPELSITKCKAIGDPLPLASCCREPNPLTESSVVRSTDTAQRFVSPIGKAVADMMKWVVAASFPSCFGLLKLTFLIHPPGCWEVKIMRLTVKLLTLGIATLFWFPRSSGFSSISNVVSGTYVRIVEALLPGPREQA